MNKFISAIFIILLSSEATQLSATLVKLSHWNYVLKDNSFAVSIWQDGDNFLLSYSFVYESGNRVNAVTDIEDFSFLIPLGKDCYLSSARNFIELPNIPIEVSICIREEYLFWTLLSNKLSSFIPNSIVLHKYEF